MPLHRRPLRPNVHLGPRITVTPDADTCQRLATAMPYVPAGSQNFARSLVQNHETYGGWTPKQAEHAHLLLERARQTYREKHAAELAQKRREREAARERFDEARETRSYDEPGAFEEEAQYPRRRRRRRRR